MSIIGNPLLLGGGGGSSGATVRIFGAKNEIVSYTGIASGQSSPLNDSGVGYITLPQKGAYTFTGGVSGYVQTANVQGDVDVYLRPVGAIYWYGAVVSNIVKESGSEPTWYADYFDWTLGSLNSGEDGAGQTSCSILCLAAVGGATNCYLTYYNGTGLPGSSAPRLALYSNDYTRYTLNFTPDTSGKTIRINGSAYGSRHISVKEWYFGDR